MSCIPSNIAEILRKAAESPPVKGVRLHSEDSLTISSPYGLPDIDYQYEKMNEIANKVFLDVKHQQELCIKGWFALAGYEFDSDEEYHTFLKTKCELVTNGRSYQVLDVVTKKEIISWYERDEFELSDTTCKATTKMIPTFKIK